jgi:hypothetical protein
MFSRSLNGIGTVIPTDVPRAENEGTPQRESV